MTDTGLLGRLIKRDLNFEQNEKWGLVLSGGGTRGAYEVGAWRAIRELKIPLRGIAGTSIGALNAAMFLGCSLKHIEEIYRTIRLTDVLPVKGNLDPERNAFDRTNLRVILREYLSQGGLDNSPLRQMLLQHLDIDAIYKSPLDLGIVTFNVAAKEPAKCFKEDIERDKLVDYLMASANFPIFKTQNVDGKKFLDGGLYDNMPFNLLIERGYTHLIVIDINGIGSTRKVEHADRVCLKMVSCSEDLGGTFDFNHERMSKNITLGYLDTLKAFHKLFGHYFFFKRPAFNDLLLNFDLDTIAGLETAARQYNMDRYKIYQADEFVDELERRHNEMDRKMAASGLHYADLIDIRRLTQNGNAIPAFVGLFTEQPTARTGPLAKAFPAISAAASAIIELKNYRRL